MSRAVQTANYTTRCLFISLACIPLTLSMGCRQPDAPRKTGPEEPTAALEPTPGASFSRQIPWIDAAEWLKVDTHVHTTFSDGSFPILAVVEAAKANGCDAVAITDHSDRNLQAASPEYFAQIRHARETFPNITVIAGLEWNIPPYNGQEHVTVLFAPEHENRLAEFKQRFDDYKRPEDDRIRVEEALNWINENVAPGAVLLLNHPSRKRDSTESIFTDLEKWRSASPAVIGFSGSPGHQLQDPIGAYRKLLKTVDRWDPATRVGGEWDQLLAQGRSIWAAVAPSDFHSEKNGDEWPGKFSETWVCAPDRTAAGIIQALQAGMFFANHGGIAREVDFRVHHQDLPRPATAGETIEIVDGTIDVSLSMMVPESDLRGTKNTIDQLELIGINEYQQKILAEMAPQPGTTWLLRQFEVPAGGITFRLRGRRTIEDGPDLMFLTNPIRVSRGPMDRP